MATANQSAGPMPFSWQASEEWDGDDGDWSTFYLRVGTPEQTVRVLPSTAGQASWVVMTGGCPPELPSPGCSDSRGALVDLNASTSRKELGLFGLNLELNFGRNESGDYGLDALALGLTPSTGGPTLNDQVVVGIETNLYRVGMFGLNQQPTNLSNFSNPHPSFLTTLKTQKSIPSLSWAYTAGAHYRSKGVFGSLTLGGQDLSRFIPNNVSFTLASSVERDLVVGLHSIHSTYSNGSTQALLSSPILSFIDSTIPYIYLPTTACQAFERELGLRWNETYNFYFVDETLHESLLTSNPNFTFTLGDNIESQSKVEIVLPYASFDHVMKPPILTNSTRYFPIRRATNESQYTLGRTFLQEAYVVTDYENNNFSIAQSKFDDGSRTEIVAIPWNNTVSHTNPVPKTSASNNVPKTLIGVAIGSSIAVVLLLCLGMLFWKHRKASKARPTRTRSPLVSPRQSEGSLADSVQEMGSNSLYNAVPELHNTARVEMRTSMTPTSRSTGDRPSTVGTMNSSPIIPELHANTVPNALSPRIDLRHSQPVHPPSLSDMGSQPRITKARQKSRAAQSSPPPVQIAKRDRRKAASPFQGTTARRTTRSVARRHKPSGSQNNYSSAASMSDQQESPEVSPIEPHSHFQLPVASHTPQLGWGRRTLSESSTYANVIDYDYYRFGTPANEMNKRSV